MTNEKQRNKVLLVDDEKLVRFTLTAFFSRSEYAITAVGSPQEAITIFQKENFDAVISDVLMEPIDGFMFRDLIRNQNKEIPIIFLTSLVNGVDNALLTRIMSDNFSYYVPKNTSKDFLLGKLNQVISFYQAQNTVRLLEQRIESSLDLASVVQHSLLPPWVHFEHDYEFSCLYRPLGKISGDLFEWIPLSAHTVLSVFGDISGHGTHSALGMTAVQSFLKQMTKYKDDKSLHPYRVAQEINDFVIRHLRNAVYMCGLIVLWDFEKNIIRFHNAGYSEMIAVSTHTGEMIPLNPEQKGSMPMGLMEGTKYEEEDDVEMAIPDDCLFIIASDGLMDVSRDEAGNENLDEDEFHELLKVMAQQEPNEDNTIGFPFRFYETLEELGYTHPQDDYSMFVIRKPPTVGQEKVFVCRIPPDKASVDMVVQQASEFVEREFDNGDEFVLKVELLLEEHLVNVVEHGIEGQQHQNDFLVLKVVCTEKNLKITVLDRGCEWHDTRTIAGEDPDRILNRLNDEFSVSGRGLPIIMKIAPQIVRERHYGLNETTFIIPREKHEEA